MSEAVNGKELKGIGGWLVLFQIYIILAVVSAVQSLLTLFLMGDIMIVLSFKPYYIILLAVVFAFALTCIILFYRKRTAFRPVFIVYGIVALASTAVYIFYGNDHLYYYTALEEYALYFASLVKIVGYVSFAISTGIVLAFIIALYKSQRVKNTFMNN